MLAALPRATFSMLAGSLTLKRLASRYGMQRTSSFARKFIAGEDVAEAIEAARAIERHGQRVTLDLLGETVRSVEDAAHATCAYVEVIGEVERSGVDRNLSVNLSQLGLHVDRATCIDNLRRILDAATPGDFFVGIDMEGAAHADQTVDAFETLWSIGYRNVGISVESSLRRSARDVKRMIELGARVRLVQGAAGEPRDVAYRQQAAIDASFVDLMKMLLRDGTSPAIATHDQAMIEATKTFAAAQGVGPGTFEFQMLYGVRRDLQAVLSGDGYRFRVYIPFGRDWFPYFMRRLGERPANVGFVIRSILTERRALGLRH
jgi:proline dehydrogenase